MNPTLSSRRVQRIRHELRLREVQVARVSPLSPHFTRVTFAGDALADFHSASFDDHVKFMFNDALGTTVRRDYTPRHHDRAARELCLEFALHGHGPAAQWARQAAPGQPAVIGGPRGSMVIPTDYDWHLLAGDGSALPAIHRRLEELPAGTRALVLLQIDDPADRREFHTAADLQLHWHATPAAWLAALRTLPLPPGEGYAWCAGEAAEMAQARQVVLEARGLPRENVKVAAYWKRGAADFHQTLTE